MSINLAKLTCFFFFFFFLSFSPVKVLLCKYSLINLGSYKKETCKHPSVGHLSALPTLQTRAGYEDGLIRDAVGMQHPVKVSFPSFALLFCPHLRLRGAWKYQILQWADLLLLASNLFPTPWSLLPSKSNEGWVNTAFLQAFSFFGDPGLTQKKIKSLPKGRGYLFLWSKSSHAAKQSLLTH